MFRLLLATVSLTGLVATAPPAHAANCAPRDALVERLASKYSEALTAGGLQSAQANSPSVMEIWASSDTGSFTVLVTSPHGISCIVATGTDFFSADAIEIKDGTAS